MATHAHNGPMETTPRPVSRTPRADGQSTRVPDEFGSQDGQMPSVLDREIRSVEADAFGHRHYARALQSHIEAPNNTPPFSIGLLGKWGIGKTSIKELYFASLREDRT